MGIPYLGEIRICSFNFAPKGWALCNGQTMAINQNQALFSILGTTYGGNGQTTFLLPNLQGRTPMHTGSAFILGESSGENFHILTTNEIPSHTHSVRAVLTPGNASTPAGDLPAIAPTGLGNTYGPPTALTPMAANAVGSAGTGAPHNNLQPYLALNFIIALQGIFPSRD